MLLFLENFQTTCNVRIIFLLKILGLRSQTLVELLVLAAFVYRKNVLIGLMLQTLPWFSFLAATISVPFPRSKSLNERVSKQRSVNQNRNVGWIPKKTFVLQVNFSVMMFHSIIFSFFSSQISKMMSRVLLTLAMLSGCAATDLTPDNFDDATAGKSVFIKFLAPW
jgi:hypothetical protein